MLFRFSPITRQSAGAQPLALKHYKHLRIRSLQHETLSHFIMDRVTSWSCANDGDLRMIHEALEASQIYQDNTLEVRVSYLL